MTALAALDATTIDITVTVDANATTTESVVVVTYSLATASAPHAAHPNFVLTTGTTPVVVASPASSGDVWTIASILVYNADTVSHTYTIKITNGTLTANLGDPFTLTTLKSTTIFLGGGGAVVSNVTASGELASSGGSTPDISHDPYPANELLAGPISGASAVPTSRFLNSADMVAGSLYPLTGLALLQHQETSGTNGGSLNNGADRTRPITTQVYDLGGIVSIAANQFTLVGGTNFLYRIHCQVQTYKVDANQLILYNVTGVTDVVRGQDGYSSSTDSTPVISSLEHVFIVSSDTTFEIRQRGTTSQATNGMGVATSLGIERYLDLYIERFQI